MKHLTRKLSYLVILLGLCLPFVASSQLAYAASCPATTQAQLANAIANGHAFTKHSGEFVNGVVIGGLAFPDPTIATAAAFEKFLNGILGAPSDQKPLVNQRHAYWDRRTGTIIISNKNAGDCGTSFRPTNGKAYYDNQR